MYILSKDSVKTRIFVERYGRIWYNNSKEVFVLSGFRMLLPPGGGGNSHPSYLV
nr:MAG TPA: hypothetical protein [Caudoviricetes sp.]